MAKLGSLMGHGDMMLMTDDPAHAFMPYPAAEVPSAADGPLKGLTFGVKDLFDVAGYPTGCGSPHMLALSGVKTRHAAAVQRLLDAGARFVGKTHTDELAFSLNGQNAHFGTPRNGAAPDRIPGGSSSGSASAVSNGLCDFALGTDTGGSVRGPASHCGLFGLRPTHGRISLEGAHDLAPTFDTCGFFARDGATFAAVADALLGPDRQGLQQRPRLLLAADTFSMLDVAVRGAFATLIQAVEARLGQAELVEATHNGFDPLYWAFRRIQGRQAWETDGAMIARYDPPLGLGVAERFAFGRDVTDEEVADFGDVPLAVPGASYQASGRGRRPAAAHHAGRRPPARRERAWARRIPQQGAQAALPIGAVWPASGLDAAGKPHWRAARPVADRAGRV